MSTPSMSVRYALPMVPPAEYDLPIVPKLCALRLRIGCEQQWRFHMRNNTQIIVAGIIVAVLGILLLNTLGGVLGLIIRIVIWMLAGMLAGRLLRGQGYGPIGDILLGLAGGIVGNLCLGLIGLGGLNNIPVLGSLIVGVIGAVIVVYLVRLVHDASFAR